MKHFQKHDVNINVITDSSASHLLSASVSASTLFSVDSNIISHVVFDVSLIKKELIKKSETELSALAVQNAKEDFIKISFVNQINVNN